MQLRHAALATAVLVQFVAAVVLVIRASGGHDVEVDEAKVAAAQTAYERRQRGQASAPTLPDRGTTPDRAQRTADREPAPEADDDPDPPPSRGARRQPSVSVDTDDDEGGGRGQVEVDDVRSPFDSGRFMEALELAEEYLEHDPEQAYIRRVAVTSACATGEIDTALEYYEQMNERDQRTSQHRCERYNVDIEAEL